MHRVRTSSTARARHPLRTLLGVAVAATTAFPLVMPASAASASTTAPPAGAAVVGGAGLPAKFKIASNAFSTRNRGYALGTGACTADTRRRCTFVVTTDDSGTTWKQRTAPAKHIVFSRGPRLYTVAGQGSLGSADVLLTNGRWLYISHDGASTWSRMALPAAVADVRVGEIATTATTIYAIVGNGPLDGGQTRLFSGPIDARRLSPVTGVQVDDNAVNVDGGWDVVANGSNVAVALGRIFVSSAYWTSHDGSTFTKSAAPCTDQQMTSLGSVSATRVDALCSYDPGMGHEFKDLYVSIDGGAWTAAGSAPDLGLTEQYEATAPGENTITSVSGASILYRSRGGGWDNPLFIPEALPFKDLHYVDAKYGFVTWGGPTQLDSAIFRTTDGGRTWDPLPIGTPPPG